MDESPVAARISVIYLHPINLKELPRHLKSIDDHYGVSDIAVVTTMWSEGSGDPSVLEKTRLQWQETTLKGTCSKMITKAEMVGPQRFEESKESAWDIIMRLGHTDRAKLVLKETS